MVDLAFVPCPPGEQDGWTGSHGPGYTERVSSARTTMWAHVADADHEAGDMAAWLSKQPKPVPLGSTWGTFIKARREKYLNGGRAPHRSVIEGVALASPNSLEVYDSRLWTVLRADTDLATCQTVFRSLGGAQRLRSIEMALSEREPGQLSLLMIDWNVAALLVSAIRLTMHIKDRKRAFHYGRLLTQVISYLGLLSRYRAGIESLWRVVAKGVLAGLDDGSHRFIECAEVLVAFSETLSARKVNLQCLSGGTRRMAASCDFHLSTLVDTFYPYVTMLSTPGAEAHDILISIIDDSGGGSTLHPPAISILKERGLFEPLSR